MATPAEAVNASVEIQEVKRYIVAYPITDYTFPSEARIDQVSLDDEYIQITLADQRRLSIPLWWIPSVYNAEPEEREKVEVNATRTMLIWDPARCAINDELRLVDYLGPCKQDR